MHAKNTAKNTEIRTKQYSRISQSVAQVRDEFTAFSYNKQRVALKAAAHTNFDHTRKFATTISLNSKFVPLNAGSVITFGDRIRESLAINPDSRGPVTF